MNIDIHSTIRSTIIMFGVNNLKEFGYPQVDTSNILTDHIYKVLFKAMLEDPVNISPSEKVEKIRLALIDEVS